MITTSCPKCGVPTPVSLAFPDMMSCPSCGFSGPVPTDAGERLKSAADLVQSQDSRLRQLTKRERRTLESGWIFNLIYAFVTIIFLTPALWFAAIFLLASFSGERVFWPGVLLALIPPLFLIGASAFGMLVVRRARKRLRHAFAAMPAPDEGSDVRCRVCGLNLPSSNKGVVRCKWCGTDHFLEAAGFRDPGIRAIEVADGFEREVERRAQSAHNSVGGAILLLGLTLGLAPVLTVVVFIVSFIVAALIEAPPLMENQYTVVETMHGRCLLEIEGSASIGYRLDFGYRRFESGERERDIPSLDDLELVDATWVVGRRVSVLSLPSDTTPEVGVVERVCSTMIGGGNYVVFDEEDYHLAGACLVED